MGAHKATPLGIVSPSLEHPTPVSASCQRRKEYYLDVLFSFGLTHDCQARPIWSNLKKILPRASTQRPLRTRVKQDIEHKPTQPKHEHQKLLTYSVSEPTQLQIFRVPTNPAPALGQGQRGHVPQADSKNIQRFPQELRVIALMSLRVSNDGNAAFTLSFLLSFVTLHVIHPGRLLAEILALAGSA